MFNGNFGDDWKWLPLILIGAAVAFLFFDPLGMNGTKITYVIDAIQPAGPAPLPLPPVVPPGQLPPPGPPPVAGFPTYETTGPKTEPVTPYAGPAILNQNGAVFDGYIFSECIQIVGDNITIRNSRFIVSCNGSPIILHAEGANLQIIDNEFIGVKEGTGLPTSAVRCSSCTVQGNRVSGTFNGFDALGTAQIIANYIGQLGGGIVNGTPTQNTGVFVSSGDGVVVRGNTIYHDCGISRQEAGGQGGCVGAVQYYALCAGCAIGAGVFDGNYVRKWNGPVEVITSVVALNAATNIRIINNTFGDVSAFCGGINGFTIAEWTANKREDGTAAAQDC